MNEDWEVNFMKKVGNKKISLVKDSMYSIGLFATILLTQFYIIIKNILPSMSIDAGSTYVSMLIEAILLLLLVVAGVLTMKKHRNREMTDELAVLNNYKAGYITKYITMFVAAIVILLVKDFNLILQDDVLGNVMCVVVICISFTELVHNIVFIILEKVQ